MSKNSESKDERLARLESILVDADISEIPMDFLSEISIIMVDETVKEFNIVELLNFGLTIKEIEIKVQEFMDDFDDDIDTIDFHINIEALATAVDNKTRGLLG